MTTAQTRYSRREFRLAPFRATFAAATLATALAVASATAGLIATPAAAQQNETGITAPPQPPSVETAPIEGDPLAPTNSPLPEPRSALEPRSAQERAEDDWRQMTGGADELLRSAQEATDPFLQQFDARFLAIALAAALGGFVGAWLSARRRASADAANASARGSTRGSTRRSSDWAAPGRSAKRGEDFEPAFEPDFEQELDHDYASRGAEPMLSAADDLDVDPDPIERRRGEQAEAERLLAFFRERFNVDDSSADGAIEYLTRLGGSVEAMRRKLTETENELERAIAAANAGAHSGGQAAPWEIIADAGRILRAAGQALRSDADYAALAHEAQLEETLRELGALRAAHAEQGLPIEAEIVEEAWPHALFRAEALALSYYPTLGEWRSLRLGLAAASTGLRMLLRREGVLVDHVRLLGALDRSAAEVWSDTSQGLRELEPVRRTVVSNAASAGEPFVIDCESFGYLDRERDIQVRSKVIVFSRAEWR